MGRPKRVQANVEGNTDDVSQPAIDLEGIVSDLETASNHREKMAARLTGIVNGMTDDQRASAMRYLIGYNIDVAASIIGQTLILYAQGAVTIEGTRGGNGASGSMEPDRTEAGNEMGVRSGGS
jgi:hypothetical protein